MNFFSFVSLSCAHKVTNRHWVLAVDLFKRRHHLWLKICSMGKEFFARSSSQSRFSSAHQKTFVTTIDAVASAKSHDRLNKRGANSEIFKNSSEICDIASSTMLMFIHEIFNHLHLEMVSNYNTTAATTTTTTSLS